MKDIILNGLTAYLILVLIVNVISCMIVIDKEMENCVRAIIYIRKHYRGIALYRKYLEISRMWFVGIVVMLLVGTFVLAYIGIKEW